MTEPRLRALATRVPPYRLPQSEVRTHAARLFGARAARLLPVFDNAGIEMRYSCVPIEWYFTRHGWKERNERYLAGALDLLETAARECLAAAALPPEAIDAIVTVSTTGIATPSLDTMLMERMALRREVQRLPVFGLGCAGGVLGLARAASLARAQAGSHVLLLVVELCGLAFRKDDEDPSSVVATALFGDGAAAAIVATSGSGPAIGAAGEHTWPGSLDIMGWSVEDDGFKALFSRDIPRLVRSELPAILAAFLARHGLTLGDIGAFVCHPGGAKVVSAFEEALGLVPGALAEARRVLRDYGNMSAATILFVLDRMLRQGLRRRMLLSALGPGFTAGFLVLDGR